jgi:hypothetical protein
VIPDCRRESPNQGGKGGSRHCRRPGLFCGDANPGESRASLQIVGLTMACSVYGVCFFSALLAMHEDGQSGRGWGMELRRERAGQTEVALVEVPPSVLVTSTISLGSFPSVPVKVPRSSEKQFVAERYGFRSNIALPFPKSTGTETCS